MIGRFVQLAMPLDRAEAVPEAATVTPVPPSERIGEEPACARCNGWDEVSNWELTRGGPWLCWKHYLEATDAIECGA